jgi:cyclophilin family peptidyl-prolyl cis-trans isomerase
MMRFTIVIALALGAGACASAPVVVAPPAPPSPSFDQKMAWILRLEDQRSLRDSAQPSPPAPPPTPERGKPAVAVPPSPIVPDLVRLLADSEARIRRRAALAVGRVGLSDGVEPLIALLQDGDPEVRQMAAFALGLIGQARARDSLVTLLDDPSPLVQGSAAEALGLIGDRTAADPIGGMLGKIFDSGGLAQLPADAVEAQRDSPAAAFRLGLFALTRLQGFDQLAAAVLDPSGLPRVRWWPVAYALERLENARALPALRTLATDPQPFTKGFAIKGLAALRDRASIPMLISLASAGDSVPAVEAVRALGRIGDPAAGNVLLGIVRNRRASAALRSEAVSALANTHAQGANDALLDLLSDGSPDVRAAALAATAALDPENFVTVLSGLDVDQSWVVRSRLASVLGTIRPEAGLPRLRLMLGDSDQRVLASVLGALVSIHDPGAAAVMLDRLKADDPAVRAAAAHALGELRPEQGAAALTAAYDFGLRDKTYIARAAALDAIARYGAVLSRPVLDRALADSDWAVRVRAAGLVKQIDPSSDADRQIRPAPTRLAPDAYEAPRLVNPPVSTEAYIDTDRGTIQIQLAVLDAPLTVENFVALARAGFFDGLETHRVVPGFVVQTGDPRGDGEGGPGYTIRDEINQLPYLQGTVGMALDWADTGGSQFFVTVSPQPQLDGKYTVFGRVLAGMDLVEGMERGEIVRRVRIWDGQN